MNEKERAREVQERMAALRRDLDVDVQSVGQSARAMADWRFYVERFPYAIAAAAVVVGFLVVPKKSQVLVPDADTLASLAKTNRVWVKTGAPKSSEGGRSMMGGLFALAATAATKAAVSWASQQFQSTLAARQQAHEARDEHEEQEAYEEHEHEDEDEEQVRRSSPYPPR